jgi:hypothetical protein
MVPRRADFHETPLGDRGEPVSCAIVGTPLVVASSRVTPPGAALALLAANRRFVEVAVCCSNGPPAVQNGNLFRFQAKPVAKDIIGMRSKPQRGAEGRRRTMVTDRPGRHFKCSASWMLHRLHNAPATEALFVVQLLGIENGARRHPGRAENAHRLVLVALPDPFPGRHRNHAI